MMAHLSGESSSGSNKLAYREGTRDVGLHLKHKIFLSHSGAQKDFVEQLCVDLERWDQHPFFDKRRDSLPIGENFPQHIFAAIRQCQVGVVILSEEFFTRSKWPMIELVAMVREAKKRELGFKIVPVFLGMSIFEFRDLLKRDGWRSCWHELALMDNRIDVQEWVDALKYLEPLNSIVYDGLGEVKFRKDIVDVLCGVVPLETRLEDSHIQGRSRLCKVIQESINVLEYEENEGVVVVGLYGMGGIGKTSICKALCNQYVGRFRGRVCHAELERMSKEELLREVLKRLTDTSHELLDRWKEDELLGKLNSGMVKEPIFLAVDNVSEVQVSIDEAKRYVLARLPNGSIVIVTSRSKETLKLVRPDLVDMRVMEMPELDVEEARSLFCKSYQMESRGEIDDQVIKRCVERCYFRKGDGNGNYHYHPLTLDVLGKQLACIDAKDWEAYLDKTDRDIFNGSGEVDHLVFSILRRSYDLLTSNDQLLFMDIALFLPSQNYRYPAYKLNTYDWLGMVYRASMDDVVCGMKRLRRKSLLENLGDGMGTSIGMHDLWRAFCRAEGQSGELRCRRWLYGTKDNMELIERCPIGGWENLGRMALLGSDSWNELERVNFSHFSNVTVLKISGLDMQNELVLDLSGLKCLKSLDIEGRDMRKLVLVGSPRCLIFLQIASSSSWIFLPALKKFVKEVGYSTKLEHLHLINYSDDKLPEMRSMVSLRVATFYECKNVVTWTGLGTKLCNLRVLHVVGWSKLQSCPSVGNLVGLEDLRFWRCDDLMRLPNLGKMKNLKILVVNGCPLITELSGLDDLVALEELSAGQVDYDWDPRYSLRLPNMSKLKNLRIMRLRGCRLVALSGFESLVSLEEVEADFRALVDKPSVRQLTKLQSLHIRRGWHLQGLNDLNNLAMLHDLRIEGCFGVDDLPDIQGLISLWTLRILDCGFKGVGGLSNLIALESLNISSCGMLERVPDLQRLTSLKWLEIRGCRMLRRWDRIVGPFESSSCRSINNYVGSEVPDCQMLTALRTLRLSACPVLEDVMAIGALSGLERMYCWRLDAVIELPDLSCFPRLKTLDMGGCERLLRLTIREPIHALTELMVCGCSSVMASLPDVSNFPALVKLDLCGREGILRLSISEPLRLLRELKVDFIFAKGPCGVKELPDLGMFPALEILVLKGCVELKSLRSSVPLPALRVLDVWECTSLSGTNLDELQALCPQCDITPYAPVVSDVEHDASDVEQDASDVEQDVSDVERNVVFERSRFQQIWGCFRN